jgi:hypothetical protein
MCAAAASKPRGRAFASSSTSWPDFSADLSDIAIALRGCERAMDTWRTRDPPATSGCIATRRCSTTRRPGFAHSWMIAGLPFDAACLDFHRSQRSVRTASAAQVRQPLRGDTARAQSVRPRSWTPCGRRWGD